MENLYRMIQFDPAQLSVIGSRPGMGKSTFALNMLVDLVSQGKKCLFISYESKTDQLLHIVETICKSRELEDFHVTICGSELSKENPIEELIIDEFDVVFVDTFHLSVMSYDPNSIYSQFKAHCRHLKNLSISNDCHIVLTSQISRKCEERPGHRPVMADLKDCSELEEIPDNVIFLIRRDYYDPIDKPGMLEFIIAKARYGDIGTGFCACHKENFSINEYKRLDQNVDW